MAAPITHIVLTDKVFNKFFHNKDRKDFFIGTVFPDIRYITNIDRLRTHFSLRSVDLNHINKEKDSFLAGLRFHSLVDDVRERFIRSKNVYSLIPESKYKTQALKILEDKLYYDKVDNWNEIIDFFDKILPEELDFNIKEQDIKKWHGILQRYFSKKPDKDSMEVFARDLNFSEEIQEEITNLIEKIRTDKKIKQASEEFYNNFESFIES